MWNVVFNLLPLNILSRIFGHIAKFRNPAFQRWAISAFAKRFRVNLSEASREIENYETLADFFLRDLKDDARPIGEGIVSPVDGRLTEWGEIANDTLLQVKGRDYSLSHFLNDVDTAKRLDGGTFLTLYLAPTDYHHVHAPCDIQVTSVKHIPGALFPVNSFSATRISELFCKNERVIVYFTCGGRAAALVFVGATNVGSIRLAFDGLRTNLSLRPPRSAHVTLKSFSTAVAFRKGERIGSFALGSTVVLLFEKGAFSSDINLRSGPVRLGETLGALRS